MRADRSEIAVQEDEGEHRQPDDLLVVHVTEHVVGAERIGIRRRQRGRHDAAHEHRDQIGERNGAEG